VARRDIQDQLVDFGGVLSKEDLRATLGGAFLEPLKPDIQIGECALANGLRRVARALEVVEFDE